MGLIHGVEVALYRRGQAARSVDVRKARLMASDLFIIFLFSVRRYDQDIDKYLYMSDLLVRNERLFYKLLSENVAELMPIVYTPTVGLACQKFGPHYSRPLGLFITIHDKGKMTMHVDKNIYYILALIPSLMTFHFDRAYLRHFEQLARERRPCHCCDRRGEDFRAG